jgi:hypothetical protein
MNTLTIFQLIRAKQLSSPHRLWRDIGWALAILTVLLVIGQVAEPTADHSEYVSFVFAMFIVAIIELGSHTFSEFKQERQAVQWFTLPATTLEKWSSNFLTSFLIVPVAFLLVITVATLLANLVIAIFGWAISMPVFNPFTYEGIKLLKFYWIIHPLLFFGAIYFKKRPMLKTFGSLSLFFIGFAIFTAWVGDLLFSDLFSDIDFDDQHYTEEEIFAHFGDFIQRGADGISVEVKGWIKLLANTLFYGYFLFFWSLSYLRLKEMEL